MKKGYNLYNLPENFRSWLIAEKDNSVNPIAKSTLKNYVSDLKHFLGWSVLKLKTKKSQNESIETLSPQKFVQFLDEKIIKEYVEYLVQNNIPHKTVNRRLSTLRKFFSFCIDQGWLKENPGKKVKNLKKGANTVEEINSVEEEIKEFQNHLLKLGFGKEKITEITSDVKEFIKVNSL